MVQLKLVVESAEDVVVGGDRNKATNSIVQVDIGKQKERSKPVSGNNPQFAREFRFKNFDPFVDRLRIALYDQPKEGSDKGSDKKQDAAAGFLGETFVDLQFLPREITLSRRLPLMNAPNALPDQTAYVNIKIVAVDFGADPTLFKKAEIVQRYIRPFHSSGDKLYNAIICLSTGRVHYSLAAALDDVSKTASSNSDTARILLLFPGRFMLMQPYRLGQNFDNVLLYGVGDGEDVISIESFQPDEPLFDVDAPIQLHLHNIMFPGTKAFVCRHRGTKINANNCAVQEITIFKPNPEYKQADQLDKSGRVVSQFIATDTNDTYTTYGGDDDTKQAQLAKKCYAIISVSNFDFD